jgi:hypothetical protein
MSRNTKRKAIILLFLALLMTALFAASLTQLEFQPGMPLPRLENNSVVAAPVDQEPPLIIPVNEFAVVVFGLILTVLIIYILYNVLRGVDWKSLPALLRPLLMISLVICAFIFLILLLPGVPGANPVEIPLPTPTPMATSPLGPIPNWLFWLVGLSLLAVGILIGAWIFIPPTREPAYLDMVALEAEKAWQAIQNGLDLKDVIIKCYRQMSLVMAQERGLERSQSMTTREFEQLLESTGIPHSPTHQLTQLFEAVRYGGWQPNPLDETTAIQCLESIISFARQVKEAG